MIEFDRPNIEVMRPFDLIKAKAEATYPGVDPELAIIANTDPTRLTESVENTWNNWKEAQKRSWEAEINYGDTVAKKSTTPTSPELFEAARRSTDATDALEALRPSELLAAQVDARRNRLTRFMRYSAIASSTVVFGFGSSTYNYFDQTHKVNAADESAPQQVDRGQVLSVGLAGAVAGSIAGFLVGGAFHEKHARRRARRIISKTNKTVDRKA